MLTLERTFELCIEVIKTWFDFVAKNARPPMNMAEAAVQPNEQAVQQNEQDQNQAETEPPVSRMVLYEKKAEPEHRINQPLHTFYPDDIVPPLEEVLEETETDEIDISKVQQQCEGCQTGLANIIANPCGHLVSCQQCIGRFLNLTECTVCQMNVLGLQKIFPLNRMEQSACVPYAKIGWQQ